MLRIIRLLTFVLVFIFVVVVAINLIVPSIAVRYINSKLPELLNTKATVGKIDIAWLSGKISAQDIYIEQPKGFKKGSLLELINGSVSINLFELLRNKIIIHQIKASDLLLDIQKNQDGKLNLIEIIPLSKGQQAPAQAAPSPPSLLIDKIAISDISINYSEAGKKVAVILPDFSIKNISLYDNKILIKLVTALNASLNFVMEEKGKKPILVDLKNLKLFVKDINNNYGQKDKLQAKATLTGQINYENFKEAYLGCYARFGPITNLPPIVGTLQVIGMELEPLKPLLPPGTYQVIGGDGIDLSTYFSVSQNFLDCKVEVATNQGKELNLSIGGSPQKPKFDTSSILFIVLSRTSGGIGGSLINISGATVDLTKSLASSVLELGEGATKIAETAGEGVLGIATGIVTADIGKVGEGLKKTTLGQAEKAKEQVQEVGGGVQKGFGEAIETAAGIAAAKKWRKFKTLRFQKAWDKAREKVDSMEIPKL